jgi:RNA polymerase sigma-70 factor (ECF subfamily)
MVGRLGSVRYIDPVRGRVSYRSSWRSHTVCDVFSMSPLAPDDNGQWYVRYGPSVLRRCRQILGNEADAWDAMHQTFERAIQRRHQFAGTGSLLRWLYSIALRVCVDDLRRRRRVDVMDPETMESVLAPLELAPATGDEMALHLVSSLLPKFRQEVQQIVVMRYFEGLSVPEIAKETDNSERTIARRLDEFITRCRRLLEKPA